MVIDFHANALPDSFVDSYISELEAESGIKSKYDGTLAALLKSMSINKIDHSVLMPVARRPEYTHIINDWAFDTSRKYSQIIPFGTVHPKNEDFRRTMKEFRLRGIKGVYFHPIRQGFKLGDEQMLHISHAAAMEDLIMVFSIGKDITDTPYEADADALKNIIKSNRGARIVVAHVGGPEQWDVISESLYGEDVYIDISFACDYLERPQLKSLIKKHGHEKVLYGSGAPWCDVNESLRYIRLLNLDKRIENAICGQNAYALLGLR